MTHTRELVGILGFGSGDRAAQYAENDLERTTNHDNVVVFSYVEGIKNPEKVAELIDRRKVATHSAGAMVLSLTRQQFPDVRPESVTIVGGPIPTDSPTLLVRRAKEVLKSELRGAAHNGSEAGSSLFHTAAMVNELRRHGRTHFGAIPTISRFDSFEFGNALVEDDIPTRIAVMSRDEFFPQSSPEFQNGLRLKLPELEVVSIEGSHCRFAKHPSEVLGEIALAQLIKYVPVLDDEPAIELPWRSSAPIPA